MFNITNYFEHPNRPGHYVFRFYDKDRADYFETLLQEKSIWYEKSIDETEGENALYLFGVKNNGYKAAEKANYLVSAKFRKKTVPNYVVRLIIYLISATLITLAIVGALKS